MLILIPVMLTTSFGLVWWHRARSHRRWLAALEAYAERDLARGRSRGHERNNV